MTHDEINDEMARRFLADVPQARIPGECIAAAMRSLPAVTDDAKPTTVDTIAPHGIGPVRLFFIVHRPQASQRRRGIAPFWICERAERIPDQAKAG